MDFYGNRIGEDGQRQFLQFLAMARIRRVRVSWIQPRPGPYQKESLEVVEPHPEPEEFGCLAKRLPSTIDC